MLNKLISLDLKYIFKTVSIYAILLFLGVIFHNITSYDTTLIFNNAGEIIGENTAPGIIQFLHTIFYNAVIAFLIGLVLNSIIRIWSRFKLNFYGDEAYLTHTLPVKRNTLWTAKFLSMIITIFFIIAWIGICFTILQLTPTGQQFVESFGLVTSASYHPDYTIYSLSNVAVQYDLSYALTIFLQFVFIALSGITGIIIAGRSNKNQTLRALISGFLVYILGGIITISTFYLISPINRSAFCFLNGIDAVCGEIGHSLIIDILLIASAIYAVLIAILYFINRKLLERGINLN